MNPSTSPDNLITHNATEQNLTHVITELKNKIIKTGDKSDATVAEQLELLEQLSTFGFGRCLIAHRGITGSWTRYMVLYPKWRKESPETAAALAPLDKWLLERSPVILATQERFTHFQRLLQQHIQDGMIVASIPCGLMDDLLTLNLSKMPNVKLIGVDLDSAAIEEGKDTAKKFHLENQTTFIKSDAWRLEIQNELDIITSNGLNFYESDDEKVVDLYKKFYTALKPNGVFITSFLTPPPLLNPESSWDMAKINTEDLRLQKVIFSYILSVRFQAYRTEKQTFQQLTQAGFTDIKILYDKAKIFPTIWAVKS
jgi:ubiquinone/menaquinone biosynthesis C-methylase UbiE